MAEKNTGNGGAMVERGEKEEEGKEELEKQ